MRIWKPPVGGYPPKSGQICPKARFGLLPLDHLHMHLHLHHTWIIGVSRRDVISSVPNDWEISSGQGLCNEQCTMCIPRPKEFPEGEFLRVKCDANGMRIKSVKINILGLWDNENSWSPAWFDNLSWKWKPTKLYDATLLKTNFAIVIKR